MSLCSRGPFVFSLLQRPLAQSQGLYFSTHSVHFRNLAEIFHADRRPDVQLDLQAGEELLNIPRKPPVIKPCPKWTQSIKKTLDGPMSEERDHLHEYCEAGFALQKHLKHRKPPLEGKELVAREKKVEQKLAEEFGVGNLEDETEVPASKVKSRTKALRKRYIWQWVPIEFDKTAALTYLVTRSAGEFASLKHIFREVKTNMPQYQPRTLFDFGSGLTTGLWAFKDTFGDLTEAFCVDPSKQMNDLARLIMGQGADKAELPAGISFRLHNPSQVGIQYDLVLSSHSLMELPSAADRLTAVHSLWRRVEDGGVLVLVELGTNAGYQLVVEARDYLLQLAQLSRVGEAEESLEGHVLAPCPHDQPCPRYLSDNVPCNFSVRYNNFDLKGLDPTVVRHETFSYVVFKKGARETEAYPRVVEEVIKTKGSIYCRLCTSEGGLQEVLCRKKMDSKLYQLAKRLSPGQQLPATLVKTEKKEKEPWTPWSQRKSSEGQGMNG